MSVEFQDYYQVLGVARDASAKEIQAAFRKLARKHHPDVNKASDAEKQFKRINEAYEVLKDPEKRKKYDQLGADWKSGQEYTAQPGWQNAGQDQGGFGQGGQGDFSDFFDMFFGRSGKGQQNPFSQGRRKWSVKGEDQEAELAVTLEEAYHGAEKAVQMKVLQEQADGTVKEVQKKYQLKIPRGIAEGKRILLRGQGAQGSNGGPAGDLYFKIRYAPHHKFAVQGIDLTTEIAISPWEATLGGKVAVPTLDGMVMMNIPQGTDSGRKFRLRGKGMPTLQASGDLLVAVKIVVPKRLNDEEKELMAQLARVSEFQPRGEGGA